MTFKIIQYFGGRRSDTLTFKNYTAKYIKIDSAYLGQLVEWPEVITEGKDIEECRAPRGLKDIGVLQRHNKNINPDTIIFQQNNYLSTPQLMYMDVPMPTESGMVRVGLPSMINSPDNK